MRIISKIIALTALLVFTVGCQAQNPKFVQDLDKGPELSIPASPTPEESVDKADVEEEEENNNVSIMLGGKKLITLPDNVIVGKRNSRPLARVIFSLLGEGLNVDKLSQELSSDFDQTALEDIYHTLRAVSGTPGHNFTVGLGEHNNGQTEVLTLMTDNNTNKVIDIVFHPKNNQLNLVDMLYMINYYLYIDPNYNSLGDRVCYNSKTSVVTECGDKTNVIKSLTATEHTNNNVVVDWSVVHAEVTSFELEVFTDEGSEVYKAASAARNFLLFGLEPSTSYVICLRALVDGVWSEYITIRHKTKR